MRVIAIGCEYSGVTTLLNALTEWGTSRGIAFHTDDHFAIPGGGPGGGLDAAEQAEFLTVAPGIKERFQRTLSPCLPVGACQAVVVALLGTCAPLTKPIMSTTCLVAQGSSWCTTSGCCGSMSTSCWAAFISRSRFMDPVRSQHCCLQPPCAAGPPDPEPLNRVHLAD